VAGTAHRRRRHRRLRPGRLAIGCVTGLLRECEHCGVNNRDGDVSARGLAGRGRQRRSCGAGAQPQGGGPLRPRRRVGVGVVGSDMGSSGVGPHHVWVINHNSLIFYGATGAQLATAIRPPTSPVDRSSRPTGPPGRGPGAPSRISRAVAPRPSIWARRRRRCARWSHMRTAWANVSLPSRGLRMAPSTSPRKRSSEVVASPSPSRRPPGR
jgi:hypothetical protein